MARIRKVVIGLTVHPEIAEALKALAAKEDRSMSAMGERILNQALALNTIIDAEEN